MRCSYNKGQNNGRYKDGRALKKNFCQDCGKELFNYRAKRCRECYHITLKGKGNPMYGKVKGRTKYECIDCHKEINNGYNRCHSCACKHIWETSDKMKNRRSYKGKNNPMYGKKRPEISHDLNPNWNSEVLICPICKKEFYKNMSCIKNAKNICCSYKCSYELKSILYKKENNPCWKGGISSEPYPFEFNDQLKKQVRYRDNYVCQNCNKTQEENNKALCVHHIDYNKDNLELSNLISLCASCHTKTNHDRDYWKNVLKLKESSLVI